MVWRRENSLRWPAMERNNGVSDFKSACSTQSNVFTADPGGCAV